MVDRTDQIPGDPAEDPQDGPISVEIENVGGIDRTSVSFEPGITVLAGRNATNRTSFLRALMAALGSDDVALKADAEEGRVSLALGDETYERVLTRRGDAVATSGSPYLDDPEVADRFAFLLESNRARRAVTRGDDLRDIIMEPLDTAAIESKIGDLESEKGEVDERLDSLGDLESEADDLRQRRDEVDAEIRDVESELADKRREMEEIDAGIETTTERQAELEAQLDELQSTRAELESVRYDVETARRSLEEYEAELDDVEDALESVGDPETDRSSIETELSERHDRRQRLSEAVNRLQNLVQFNEDQLGERDGTVLDELEEDDAPLADGLTAGEEVVCWTCGSSVERSHVEETLDALRDLRRSKLERRRELEDEIEALQAEKEEVEAARRRRAELESTRERLTTEAEETRDRIESLEERREELADRVDSLEARVDELRAEEQSELLEVHEEANELEFELERLETERESVDDELSVVEERLEEADRLRDRRAEIADELDELRTRVRRLEESAVETFNEEMETVLERLEYDNVERVWIERAETSVREGRRTVSKTEFDLHVVRSSPSGTVYEDAVDHLSESERKVVGLVFALAGFIVHDVYEQVPFVLLDSVEALDSERIATLTEYVGQYADNLVVALLPEDAAALDDRYERVTDI